MASRLSVRGQTIEIAVSMDARRTSRVLRIYRVSAIETGRQRGFCVVRNVSNGGAMVQTVLDMAVDEPVHLVLASGIRIRGSVRWKNATSVGIGFDHDMSIATILGRGDHDAPDRRTRRLPRLDIVLAVRIAASWGKRTVTASDISMHGLRITCEGLAVGKPLRFTLPRFADIPARILWSRDGEAGLLFEAPLGADDLTFWLNGLDGDAPCRSEKGIFCASHDISMAWSEGVNKAARMAAIRNVTSHRPYTKA